MAELKYTQEQYKNKVESMFPNVLVVGKYKGSSIPTRVRFKECGHEHNMTLALLKRNSECPICKGTVIQRGVNDLWITHPEIAELLLDPEDCVFGVNTREKHWFKCPICGYKKFVRPRNILDNGLCCPCSSDGFSSGEKGMMYILNHNNIDYEGQKVFDWSERRKYDFYLEKYSLIIEVNGAQHYTGVNMFSERDEIENDKHKKSIAIENGIKNYVYVNYSVTSLDFLLDSIKQTSLVDLLKLDLQIDKTECCNYMSSSFKRLTWELWQNGNNSSQIHELTGISKRAISTYLNEGNKYGIIEYDGKLERKKGSYTRIICVTTGEVFDGIELAKEKYGIENISGCCCGQIKSAGRHPITKEPLVWMYYDEYQKNGPREYDNKTERKIVCLNNKYVFRNITIASQWCNLKSSSSITQYMNRVKNNSYAGRHPETNEKLQWMYYDDYVKDNSEADLIYYSELVKELKGA